MSASAPQLTRRELIAKAATLTTAGLIVPNLLAAEEKEPEVTATEDLMREHGVVRRALLVYIESIPKIRSNAASLEEQVQEELGIGDPHMSPLREAWVTGAATAIGALIPVFPFLIWRGTTAIVVAFVIAMASHWIVGAARSVFTGRSVFRSGLDMFVVGLGVAIVGFFVGDWVAKVVA